MKPNKETLRSEGAPKMPDRPNALNPNMVRALVILLLTIPNAARAQQIIDQLIQFSAQTSTATGQDTSKTESSSQPIPSHTGQLIRVTGESQLEARADRQSKSSAVRHDMTIVPITTLDGECGRRAFSEVIEAQNLISQRSNGGLLFYFACERLGASQLTGTEATRITATRTTKTADVTRDYRDRFDRTLDGYRIQRTPKGVRFTTTVVECKKKGGKRNREKNGG